MEPGRGDEGRRTRNRRRWVALVAVVCSVFVVHSLLTSHPVGSKVNETQAKFPLRIYLQRNGTFSTKPPPANRRPTDIRIWRSWETQARDCLSQRFRSHSVWTFGYADVAACVDTSFVEALLLRNQDDDKLAVLPPEHHRHYRPCSLLTLGVGNDIDAELLLQEFLRPLCPMRFVGVDPDAGSGKIYERIGQYVQTAVSATGGLQKANVLENDKYEEKLINTTSLVDLLDNLDMPIIDYLLLDNEGAEYDLLRQLMYGDKLQRSGVLVCQISVELHGPLSYYNQTDDQVSQLMIDLIEKSPMLPLWFTEPINHIRAFLINAQDPYCVRQFFLRHRSIS